jgi:hypothetical protein
MTEKTVTPLWDKKSWYNGCVTHWLSWLPLGTFHSILWDKYRGSIPAGHNCFNSSPAIILSAECPWWLLHLRRGCKQSVLLVAHNSTANTFHRTYKTERGERYFSLLHRVQIRPKAHPDSYQGFFPSRRNLFHGIIYGEFYQINQHISVHSSLLSSRTVLSLMNTLSCCDTMFL